MLGAGASQGRAGSIIEIQALRALALAACGDHASALGALTEGLTLACPQGYVRVLADEPLTGRELEVLRLIATGRSNQRIGHELMAALDTVRST